MTPRKQALPQWEPEKGPCSFSSSEFSHHIRTPLPKRTKREGPREELKKVYLIDLLLEHDLEASMFLLHLEATWTTQLRD